MSTKPSLAFGDTGIHLQRFNGKEADQISKLNYDDGFRHYDPLSLTWTRGDTPGSCAASFAELGPQRADSLLTA